MSVSPFFRAEEEERGGAMIREYAMDGYEVFFPESNLSAFPILDIRSLVGVGRSRWYGVGGAGSWLALRYDHHLLSTTQKTARIECARTYGVTVF